MRSIRKHIFSSKDRIPVYKDKNGLDVLGYLFMGEWMGLLHEESLRSQIITSTLVGWVLNSDVTEKSFPLDHIHTEYLNGEIRYVLNH